MAIGKVSYQRGFCRPEFNDANTFEIVECRHPLAEMSMSRFVPNDFASGPEQKLKIITGPNASGKSVYLKQVGLITYLAQCGCFVPAQSAKLPLVDKIFTRIKISDAMTVEKSTFLQDLSQMDDALKNATGRSLVLIDEFGKGTNPSNGLALMAASLRHWLSNEAAMPHILVATHFHSISSFLPIDHPQMHYQKFNVQEDAKDYEYLFKISDGKADSSLAVEIAIQAGIPKKVTQRADLLIQKFVTKEKVVPEFGKQLGRTFKKSLAISRAFLRTTFSEDDEEANAEILKSLLANR